VISAITQLNSAGVNHRASTDRVREREPVLQTLAALSRTSSPSRSQTAAASLKLVQRVRRLQVLLHPALDHRHGRGDLLAAADAARRQYACSLGVRRSTNWNVF
jgi:hypothetical protein